MAARWSLGRLFTGLCVVSLLVASLADSPSPTAGADPSPSLSPLPSSGGPPGRDPTSYPPDAAGVVVTGSLSCGVDLTESSTKGGITTYTGPLTCTHSMSDPRVSGTEVSDLTVVWTDQPGLVIDEWFYPTGTLTNDGGSWRASGWGSEFWDENEAIHTSGTSVYIGEGAYAGLVYRLLYAQGAGIGGDEVEYIAAGWIEPAG